MGRLSVARWIAVALLCLVGSQALADPTGGYRVERTSADGATQAGKALVAPSGRAFALEWDLEDGGRYRGLGLQVDDVLGAVFWPQEEKFEGLGIVLYRIDGGRMQGVWMPTGGSNVPPGRENLIGAPGLEGRFDVTLGENPGGRSNYRGHVVIERRGEIYYFHWYTPTDSYVGNGVRIGNIMVVGYALGRAPGTVAYCLRGNRLDGLWSYAAETRTGRELLRPPGEAPVGKPGVATAGKAECAGTIAAIRSSVDAAALALPQQ